MECVNDCLLDHCQVSSVPHYCVFKEQEIPRIYTVWMVIYWNSNVNIIIFWDADFWLSLAVSKTKTFEVFYFTCNESKIYESLTLKLTFVPVYIYIYIYIQYIYIYTVYIYIYWQIKLILKGLNKTYFYFYTTLSCRYPWTASLSGPDIKTGFRRVSATSG